MNLYQVFSIIMQELLEKILIIMRLFKLLGYCTISIMNCLFIFLAQILDQNLYARYILFHVFLYSDVVFPYLKELSEGIKNMRE